MKRGGPQLGALKEPMDVQGVAYMFSGMSPPATPPPRPEAGSTAQTPRLQGVGVQTPVCTWGSETAPSHSPPLPSPPRLLPASPGVTWEEREAQDLSPQVREKVGARAPLCSQGQDSSGVQPTPVKPPPPRSWAGAHSAFQMCTHLPAGRCTQPHR